MSLNFDAVLSSQEFYWPLGSVHDLGGGQENSISGLYIIAWHFRYYGVPMKRTGPKLVSRSGGPPVAEDPATARSEAPPAVAPHAEKYPTLVSRGSQLSSYPLQRVGVVIQGESRMR